MLLKSILISFAIAQFAIAIDEPKVGLDSLKTQYEVLKNCQTKLCRDTYGVSIADSSEYQACQVGCNYNTFVSKNCNENCKNYLGKQFEACKKGCEYEDVEEEQKPSISEIVDQLKNEKTEGDKSNDNVFDKLVNPFFLINGEPDGKVPDLSSTIVEIQPDEDSNEKLIDGSIEENTNNKQKNDEESSDSSSSLSIFNPFKIMDIVNNAIEKAREKFKDGNFIYYAKLLENGTILESFDKPIDDSSIDDTNRIEQPPFKILSALFGDNRPNVNDNDNFFNSNNNNLILNDDELRPGHHPNWKGRPLPIGNPIVEEIDGNDLPPSYHRGYFYRECRPIKFQLSTLCHDINNFFNCASLRTGLPRWFFLSLILLCSLFMVWLGIFILSVIRRMKRRERTIHYDEDQLPLYKDVVIEEKVPPKNIYQAEPLPEKVKLQDA